MFRSPAIYSFISYLYTQLFSVSKYSEEGFKTKFKIDQDFLEQTNKL